MTLTVAQREALAAAHRSPQGQLVRDHKGWFAFGTLARRWRAAGSTIRALASRELLEIGPDCNHAKITIAGRQALISELHRLAKADRPDH